MSDAVVREVRRAYEGAADAWARGPSRVYLRLAQALVESSPEPLAGRLALDLGAGTGVISQVLDAVGARAVGLDLALDMLVHQRDQRPAGSVGDALRLPFRDGGFDAVLAAFSLNHLPDPVQGLRECRRVARAGGLVLASTFPADGEHPAKHGVESVLERFGYERPAWYAEFKDNAASLTGDPDTFEHAAAAAGLVDVTVGRLDVDAGLDDAELAVEWRLNMPQVRGFVAGLEPEARVALRASAAAAIRGSLPASVSILVLSAWVP